MNQGLHRYCSVEFRPLAKLHMVRLSLQKCLEGMVDECRWPFQPFAFNFRSFRQHRRLSFWCTSEVSMPGLWPKHTEEALSFSGPSCWYYICSRVIEFLWDVVHEICLKVCIRYLYLHWIPFPMEMASIQHCLLCNELAIAAYQCMLLMTTCSFWF